MKNKTTYRLDGTYNNDRLCIDVRDNLSLLQALTSDKQLHLDPYTMAYMISLNRSLLLTAENVEEDTIKITSNRLYQIKDAILNEDKLTKKQEKKQEKVLKKKAKKKGKEDTEETVKETQKIDFGLVEVQLNEDDLDDEEKEEYFEEDDSDEEYEEDKE